MNEILLISLIERIVIALEAIAENTKSEDVKEKDSRITGFSAEGNGHGNSRTHD